VRENQYRTQAKENHHVKDWLGHRGFIAIEITTLHSKTHYSKPTFTTDKSNKLIFSILTEIIQYPLMIKMIPIRKVRILKDLITILNKISHLRTSTIRRTLNY